MPTRDVNQALNFLGGRGEGGGGVRTDVNGEVKFIEN